MVAPRPLQHIRHKLRTDRCTRLILLVLPRVRKIRHDSRDTTGRGCLAGFDDDEELHEAVVELLAGLGRLDDEDVFVADGFTHYDGGFLVGVFEDGHVEEVDAESGRGLVVVGDKGDVGVPVCNHFGELGVGVAGEELNGV